jgi:hypothetical protein
MILIRLINVLNHTIFQLPKVSKRLTEIIPRLREAEHRMTEITIARVLCDPMIIFGLALIMLGVILSFTIGGTSSSLALFFGIGLTAGRLSSLAGRS